jgi:4-hydroxythreonine-4-phosphate dehydrogenase
MARISRNTRIEYFSEQTPDESNKHRPVIGITLGDTNGIGPEVVIKCLADARVTKYFTVVIYGSTSVITKYKKQLGLDFSYHQLGHFNNYTINEKKINIVNCWTEQVNIEPGKPTPESGKCAYWALRAATDALKSGTIDAVVTAPINKKNMPEDFGFAGHTEYFTKHFGNNDSLMFLTADNFRVGVVTGHIPLKDVSAAITPERLARKLELMNYSLRVDFNIPKPKIAVLGLNPHAGEGGMLGDEEQKVILPVIEKLKNKGILVFGAFPSDGFFGSGHYEKFDAVLAMYHDQGLIPFKTLAFDRGVNFTAGLSVVRTSPDHGTAYDIAGKSIANESAMLEAIFAAYEIVKNRNRHLEEQIMRDERKVRQEQVIKEVGDLSAEGE